MKEFINSLLSYLRKVSSTNSATKRAAKGCCFLFPLGLLIVALTLLLQWLGIM